MFITTVTKGDDTTYRLHRDACKALNDSKRTVEAQLTADAQIVIDASPCSTCKPSKAVQVSVRTEAEKALKGKAPKTAKGGEESKFEDAHAGDTVTERLGDPDQYKRPEPEKAAAAPAEAAEQGDKAAPPAEKPADATKAEATEEPKTGRGRSLAVKDGEQKCDTCGQTLPLTKFPTLSSKAGEVPARGTTCREDIKKARAEKKAAAAKTS